MSWSLHEPVRFAVLGSGLEMATRYRYGIRRFAWLVVFLGGIATVAAGWASKLDRPTRIFPLGTLPPEQARRVVFAIVGLIAAYLLFMAYLRFVRKPAVVVEKTSLTVPQGEFGIRSVVLKKGDVLDLDDHKRSRWKAVHVRHSAGTFTLWASQLPSDADYEKVRSKLSALCRRSR